MIMSSCEKTDTTSYMPTWKGFEVSPKPAVPGDSLTVVAVQSEIGHLIYSAIYEWTVTYCLPNIYGADSAVTKSFKQNVVYDYDPSDPRLRFLVPANVTATPINVRFSGTYNYSAQGAYATDGSTIQDGFDGMLHRSQSSALSGLSTGSVTINVKTE